MMNIAGNSLSFSTLAQGHRQGASSLDLRGARCIVKLGDAGYFLRSVSQNQDDLNFAGELDNEMFAMRAICSL